MKKVKNFENFSEIKEDVSQTRSIEVYIGYGSDSGTWLTEYVDIPLDTPDDKIESVAIDVAKSQFRDTAFIGLYSIPESMGDTDEYYQ